jgi:hypothetical protein
MGVNTEILTFVDWQKPLQGFAGVSMVKLDSIKNPLSIKKKQRYTPV